MWEVPVSEGQAVSHGDVLAVIESMKMEIQITAPHDGTVHAIRKTAGAQVSAGQPLIWLEVHDL